MAWKRPRVRIPLAPLNGWISPTCNDNGVRLPRRFPWVCKVTNRSIIEFTWSGTRTYAQCPAPIVRPSSRSGSSVSTRSRARGMLPPWTMSRIGAVTPAAARSPSQARMLEKTPHKHGLGYAAHVLDESALRSSIEEPTASAGPRASHLPFTHGAGSPQVRPGPGSVSRAVQKSSGM